MSITVISTSDTPEQVTAAMGSQKPTESVTPTETKAQEPATQEEVSAKATEEETHEAESTETEEQAEADDDDVSEDHEELETKSDDAETKSKKKTGLQRRFEKFNKRLSEKDQEIEFWKQKAMSPKSEAETKTASETTQDLSKKPKADDFTTHEDYVEALTEWKLDQKLAAQKAKEREESAKRETQTRLQKHQERVSQFREAHDDFDDVVASVSQIPLSLTVQEAILDSDDGAALMYELSKNPKELKRICELSPIAAAKEVGKIEARLTKPVSESSKKTTSKAPPPITPVKTRSTTQVKSIYDDGLSQREFERLRAEQLKQRRQGL